jgi:hypothetical protein
MNAVDTTGVQTILPTAVIDHVSAPRPRRGER